MNTFVKLYILVENKQRCFLLYGYAVPDEDNEERPWGIGKFGKDKKFCQCTCVMNDEEFQKFESSLVDREFRIRCGTDEMILYLNLVKRPETLFYPKGDLDKRSMSLVKKLSRVREYWNLEKSRLFENMERLYFSSSYKEQRCKINAVLSKLSKETGICFLREAAERLGNMEIYNPNKKLLEIKSLNEQSKKIERGLIVKKYEKISKDLLVNCEIWNANRCILNKTKVLRSDLDRISFEANQAIDEVKISVWEKDSGELIQIEQFYLIRQVKFDFYVDSKTYYRLSDTWIDTLEKTFGQDENSQKKIDEIKKIKKQDFHITSQVHGTQNDAWNDAGIEGIKWAKNYRNAKGKGVFCKKVAKREGEIDSFIAIAQYLNDIEVEKAIIVDPYFSVRSMEKILTRITNAKLKLTIVTSLADVDPDKDEENVQEGGYIEKAKHFLESNVDIISQYLKIVNVTKNGKTAIHDRYLLCLKNDKEVEGYLLSNSINSAGKSFSFVIAQMDENTVYEVMEYVSDIIDIEVQKKLNKDERLNIKVLWDTFDKKYEKKTPSIEKKIWEEEMIKKLENKEKLDLIVLFDDQWCDDISKAEERICRLCWYLFYSNDLRPDDCISWMRENRIDIVKFVNIGKEIAKKLEEEEALLENLNVNKSCSESFSYRCALDSENENNVRIDSQYLANSVLRIYYSENKYVGMLYELLFCISPKDMISLMQEVHSPKALEVLLEHMYSNEYNLEIYKALLHSNLSWLQDLAYYYWATVFVRRIKDNMDIWNDEVTNYMHSNPQVAICQYACWCEQLFSEYMREKQRKICGLRSLQRKEEVINECIQRLAKELDLLFKDKIEFEKERFWKFFYGRNDAVNSNATLLLWKNVNSDAVKCMLEEKGISLLKDRWDQERLFHRSDYEITYLAAYLSCEHWEKNVREMLKELRINEKMLHQVLQPTLRDIDYDKWNLLVQNVLWQLLFLEYYVGCLKEKFSEEDEGIQVVEKLIEKLEKIESQCGDWYDINLLAENLFGKNNI